MIQHMTGPRAPEITPEEVEDKLAGGEQVVVLDVREPDEVQAWPFPGSVHIPLGDVLQDRLGALPRGGEVVTMCAHGNRSAEAAVALRRRGIGARSMRGGMAAWSQVYDVAPIAIGGAMGEAADVLQFRRLGKGCMSYLVLAGGEGAVIDPAFHTGQYLQAAAARGAAIRHVIDTHLHVDHISGARRLAEESGATLHLNPVDRFAFDRFDAVGEGDSLHVGSLRLTALAAPGHTPGSLVWDLGGRALVTGDVLFLESIGRPDLHGQAERYARDLYHTLGRLAALSPDLLILPGHMPETVPMIYGTPHADRLGAVRARLGLGGEDEAAFVARVSRVSAEEAGVLEEGPNRCAVKA